MKAAWYRRHGSAREVIEIGDLPTPDPEPGEVLVEVAFSGVNNSDCIARAGVRPLTSPWGKAIVYGVGAPSVTLPGPTLTVLAPALQFFIAYTLPAEVRVRGITAVNAALAGADGKVLLELQHGVHP